jgi:transcription antitermination factor NusG
MSILETMHESTLSTPISDQTAVGERKWYAIQTRARHEKKVDAQLHDKGIEAFLPLSSEKHQWSDRQRIVHQPLFSGYLFVHIADSLQMRNEILTTSGVCWFVGNHGMGLPIPDKQILDIQTILACSVPYSPFPFVRIGQRVKIRSGCLDGVEGILISKDSDRTLLVSIDLVRRSLSIHINGYEIEEV